jgi:hypothetical protein
LNLIDEVFHIRRESIIHEDRYIEVFGSGEFLSPIEIRLNLLERLNALRNYKVIHRFLSWAGARLSSFTSQPGLSRILQATRVEPGRERIEPPRVFRRLFRLSHAAMAGWSSVA